MARCEIQDASLKNEHSNEMRMLVVASSMMGWYVRPDEFMVVVCLGVALVIESFGDGATHEHSLLTPPPTQP